MLSVPIAAVEDLDRLANAGVDQSRVLAWTGITAPNPALNQALAERGVEVLFGTVGGSQSLDQRFNREGDGGYRQVAATGVHMIATGRPASAFQVLDPVAGPVAQCSTRR
jgi:glycerophosphoryl diester phosphodiesterase